MDPALLVVAAEQAGIWRQRRDLLLDEDFAFYFSSTAEALKAGGQAVADMWQHVRAEQELGLMSAGAAAYAFQDELHSAGRQSAAASSSSSKATLRSSRGRSAGPRKVVTAGKTDQRMQRELTSKLDH